MLFTNFLSYLKALYKSFNSMQDISIFNQYIMLEASIEKDKEDCMNSQDSGFGTQILTQGIAQKSFPCQCLKRFTFRVKFC